MMVESSTSRDASRRLTAHDFGRWGWILLALVTAALFAVGIPGRLEALTAEVDVRALTQLSIPVRRYALYVLALDVIVVISHINMAALIVWRSARRPGAIFVAATLVANGALLPLALMYTRADPDPLLGLAADAVIAIGLFSSIALLYVFPDGRFIPRWTRPLAVVWGVLVILAIFFPASPVSLTTWSPLLQALVLLAFSGSGAAAQVYRFDQVAGPTERQQVKWALLGLMAATIGPLTYFIPFVIFRAGSGAAPNLLFQRTGGSFFSFSILVELAGQTLFSLALLIFPITFAIAVLRYRLWDIDLIIRRTLIYTFLTGLLAIIYFLTVLLLQSLVERLFEASSPLIIVLSTLLIASLFAPLRTRVQFFIDRQFYRNKIDAAETLAAFAMTMRDETNLDQLQADLLRVIEQTLHPEQACLWFRPLDRGGLPADRRRP